jgi:hypothetical protein
MTAIFIAGFRHESNIQATSLANLSLNDCTLELASVFNFCPTCSALTV